MTPLPKKQDPLYQAQAILSRRDHSVYELKQKLARKKFSPQVIADTLDKLARHRLIDDERFAEAYVTSALAAKPVGPRWLNQKLSQKGVAADIRTAAIAAAFTDRSERDVARAAAARWRRAHPAHADDRVRLARYLAGRGFSSDAAVSALETRS